MVIILIKKEEEEENKITIHATTQRQLQSIFGGKFFIVYVCKYISIDTFIHISVFLEFVNEI